MAKNTIKKQIPLEKNTPPFPQNLFHKQNIKQHSFVTVMIKTDEIKLMT